MTRLRIASTALVQLVAVAVAVLALVLSGASPARAAQLTPIGTQSFSRIAACAANSDHLLASIVVDSSGSLRDTDPSAARVEAIQVALDSLQQLQVSRSGLDVRADLAVFSNAYHRLVAWGSVGGTHGNRLRSTASGELPKRAAGGTDYLAALRGAQRSIDAEAKSLGGTSCKIALWFTDGGLDLGDSTSTAAARTQLCEAQGAVDGLRRDGVAVVALALFAQGGAGGVTSRDRDRLRAIAEGSGSAETCGTVPIPPEAATGAYLRATDAGAIGRLFAQAAALIAGGSSAGSFQCPGSACTDGRLVVPVDAGVQGFRLVVDAGSADGVATLVAPDGTAVPLTADTQRILRGSNRVTVQRQGSLATAEVRLGSSGAHRAWTLRTSASRPTTVDLYYFWGARLAVAAPQHLTVGERGVVRISAKDFLGSPLRDGDYASVALQATVDGRPVTATKTGPGEWTVGVKVPLSSAASAVTVGASLEATSAAHRLRIGPISTERSLKAVLPAYFPSVSPSRLAFSPLLGQHEAAATVTLSGSDKGVTQACFAPVAVAGPSQAGRVTATPETGCVTVEPGSRKSVRVRLAAANPADGSVTGVLPIRVRGVHGETATIRLPVDARMVRPVDEPLRWGLVALFTLLAILGAALAGHVGRVISDRFRVGIDARVAAVPVVITRSGIRRAEPDRAADLLDPVKDFRHAGYSRPLRLSRLEFGGLTLRRSFPWFPLRPAQGWVAADNGDIVAAPTEREWFGRPDGSRAPVSFPGTQGFYLTVQPLSAERYDGELKGRLVVMIDERAGVASVLPDRIAAVRSVDWDRFTDAVLRVAHGRSVPAEASKDGPAARKEPRQRPSAPSAQPAWADPGSAATGGGTAQPDFEWAGTSRSISWDRDLPASPVPSSGSGSSVPARTPRFTDPSSSAQPPDDDGPSFARPSSSLNFWD